MALAESITIEAPPSGARRPSRKRALAAALSALCVAGCLVGPNYQKPLVEVPSGFKEAVDWGWANIAVPAEDLDDEVAALADQLAKVPLTHLMFRKVSLNRVWDEMGFRNSLAAGIDFDPLAHKSTEGLEMEDRVASDGFINVGREMYTAYPARHGHA